MKMRVFHVSEQGKPLEPAWYDVPDPGPGQVRVRVLACGICHSDSYALSGIPGMTYPLIPGHEIAGVVDAVGPAVARWTIGDRVGVGWFGGQCGQCDSCRSGKFVVCPNLRAPGLIVAGGYAEYVTVPATALARVPDGIDPVHAGPLMCAGVTAFNALRRAGAGAGDRVTVLGIGGIGHLAIQFARRMGCETIAASHGREKEDQALKLGAHHFVDAAAPGCADEIIALGGTDIVLVTSPNGDDVTRFMPAVAPEGRIVVTGFSAEPIAVNSVDLISRNLSLLGSVAGTSKDAEETLSFSALNDIMPAVEEFPFDDARAAFEHMMSGAPRFRAVLVLDEDDRSGARAATPSVTVRPATRAGSALDCPPDELPGIDELIEAAMRWHFSPETGSAFWLDRVKDLDFDPVRDVHGLADLKLFPNIVDDLRSVRVRDLIPRGYGSEPPVGVFESGGATGQPKRVVLMRDGLERWLAWDRKSAAERKYPLAPNHLMVAPTGPHIMTYLLMEGVRQQNGTVFTIDLDPRWVRACINDGRTEEAERYSEHLIAQITAIIETQDIDMLTVTPPLLEKLAQRPSLAESIGRKVAVISWGGTHMDADTRRLYRAEVFPQIMIQGGYGSTMTLGGSLERLNSGYDDLCVFDPFAPYVTYSVVDPGTGAEVPYGERGQVVMNYVSKGMFVPNNLERDTAIRIPGLPGQAGDSVADVLPVRRFQGADVTEGVY